MPYAQGLALSLHYVKLDQKWSLLFEGNHNIVGGVV